MQRRAAVPAKGTELIATNPPLSLSLSHTLTHTHTHTHKAAAMNRMGVESDHDLMTLHNELI